MASQHDLCAVVEQTLIKVGISNVMRRVKLVTTVERTQVIEVPEDLLNGYTEEQVQTAAKQYINGRQGGTGAREWNQVRRVSGPNEVVGATVVEIVPPTPVLDSHGRFFISNEGRVVHLVPLTMERHNHAARGSASLCGKRPGWRWEQHSSRARNDRASVCTQCAKVAARMTS